MWAYVAAFEAATAGISSVRPMPSGLWVDPYQPWKGECKGCGAPWVIHPLQNTGAPGSRLYERMNLCSYCLRPFRL